MIDEVFECVSVCVCVGGMCGACNMTSKCLAVCFEESAQWRSWARPRGVWGHAPPGKLNFRPSKAVFGAF